MIDTAQPMRNARPYRLAPGRTRGSSSQATAKAAPTATRNLPSVGVVIPTRDRPEALSQALKAVFAQDYAGPMRVIVVYDGTPPDYLLSRALPRPVMVLSNWRTPGLAGTRNTGVLGLDTDLVAFCDDDTVWDSAKINAQVQALIARPEAELSRARSRSNTSVAGSGGWPIRTPYASRTSSPRARRCSTRRRS